MAYIFDIDGFLQALDAKDIEAYCRFYRSDAWFTFGNRPTFRGTKKIRAEVEQLLRAVESLKHEVCESWKVNDAVIFYGKVAYMKKNNATATLPYSVIAKVAQEKIYFYQIFIDPGDVFEK